MPDGHRGKGDRYSTKYGNLQISLIYLLRSRVEIPNVLNWRKNMVIYQCKVSLFVLMTLTSPYSLINIFKSKRNNSLFNLLGFRFTSSTS